MASLTVIDRTFPENTFGEENKGMFSLLQRVADLYGEDVIDSNWENLVNFLPVRLEFDSGQKVLIMFHRD